MQQARERMTTLQSLSRGAVIAHGRETNPAWSQAELEPWADAKLRFNLRALNRMGTSVENWEGVWVIFAAARSCLPPMSSGAPL
ncbi:MAG: hypothetical protein R3E79_27065 [Caldilineaceae bacterium]